MKTLLLTLLLLSSCSTNNQRLEADFQYFIGDASYIEQISLGNQNCIVNNDCYNDRNPIQTYSIYGRFLPEASPHSTIVIAHKFESVIDTSRPWLLKLSPIDNEQVKEISGASYYLESVDSARNIFCPRENQAWLFSNENWERANNGYGCYAF